MKRPEYVEGPEAQENFEQGMKALFKAPKTETTKGKQKDRSRVSSIYLPLKRPSPTTTKPASRKSSAPAKPATTAPSRAR